MDFGQEETSKNFPSNTQKRDAMIVVAIPMIVLVEQGCAGRMRPARSFLVARDIISL